jgi:hypothetical protein
MTAQGKRHLKTYRQNVVDKKKVNNQPAPIIRIYSGALAGIHIFSILSKKHLGTY